MVTLNHVENEIRHIKQRNKRVEMDKAWETSKTRTVTISLMMYLVLGLFLSASWIPYPWLNAIIPTLAFFLSTLSLPFFKDFWKKKIYKGN